MGFIYRLTNISKENVEEIEDWLFECEISESDIIEHLRSELELETRPIWDIEIKQLVFEFILSKADVGELIQYVSIDDSKKVSIRPGETSPRIYINTSKKEIITSFKNVLIEDRLDAWLFLVEYLGVEIDIDDDK